MILLPAMANVPEPGFVPQAPGPVAEQQRVEHAPAHRNDDPGCKSINR